MKKNLRMVFGDTITESRMRSILYQSWKNLFITVFETIRFPAHGERYIRQLIPHHFERIDRTMQQDKGCILLAPHTGNFFMGAAYIARYYPVSVMIRPPSNSLAQSMVKRALNSMRFETISRVGGMHRAVRALRKNRLLVIALDQHAGGQGIWVDFFGQEASTYPTAAFLALRYDIPVHIGYLHRHPNGTNEGWVLEPFELIRTGDMEEDIRLNTLQFSQKIEEIIRQYPETWFWMHQRWKEKPHDVRH